MSPRLIAAIAFHAVKEVAIVINCVCVVFPALFGMWLPRDNDRLSSISFRLHRACSVERRWALHFCAGYARATSTKRSSATVC